MTDKTGEYLHGILIPDESFTFANLVAKDDATMPSSYTQGGATVGVPEPDQETGMCCTATGEQAEDGHVEAVTLAAGLPGMDSAHFGFRDVEALDKTNEIRGSDGPTVIHDFACPNWTSDATHVRSRHHALTLHSGRVLCVGDQTNAANDYKHRIYRYDPVDATLATVVMVPEDTDDDLGPTILQLQPTPEVPLGRVLLITKAATRVGSRFQADVYASDDEGDTWTIASRTALNHGIPEDIGGNAVSVADMRCGYSPITGEAILLWAYTYTSGPTNVQTVAQYASADGGLTWDQILEDWYDNHYVGAGDFQMLRVPDILPLPQGGFLVAGWVLDPAGFVSTLNYATLRIGTPFAAMGRMIEVITGLAPTATTRADVAIWRNDAGIIYALCRRVEVDASSRGGGHLALYVSYESGANWNENNGTSVMSISVLSLDNNYTVAPVADIRQFGAATTCGRVIVPCRWTATDAHAEYSSGLLTIGGYRSVTVPARKDSIRALGDMEGVAWAQEFGGGILGHCYLPVDFPDALGWTAVGGAAGDALLTNASDRTVLEIDTTIATGSGTANAREYYWEWADATVTSAFVEFVVEAMTAGAPTHRTCVKIRISDGVTSQSVNVLVSDTNIQLWDPDAGGGAGANLGSAGTASGRVRIQVAIDSGGNAQAWYSSDEGVAPRVYRLTGGSLAGGVAVTNLIRFGHGAAVECRSKWTMVGDSFWPGAWRINASSVAIGDSARWTNPTDLRGIPSSPDPTLIVPTATGNGLRVGFMGGPTAIGETWQIRASYRYPLEAAFSERYPSPSRRWRTSTTGSPFVLVWDPLTGTTASRRLHGSFLGLYLGDTNVRRVILAGYTGGVWTDLITTDSSVGLAGITFTRVGDCVTPAAGVAAGRYFLESEFAGAWVELDSGAGNVKKRRIRDNTSGIWDTTVTALRPRLYFDGLDGTEPTSGTMIITPRHSLVVVDGITGTYQYYRLTAVDAGNADGYFEIGTLAIGRLLVLAPAWSSGYSRSMTPTVTATDLQSGGRRARRAGPPVRGMEIGWVDGVVSHRIQGTLSPDYERASAGGLPVANLGAVPFDLWGALSALSGEASPIVLFGGIPVQTVTTLYQETLPPGIRYLYSTIVPGSVRIENIRGNEWADEVSRVGTLAVREIT